MPTSSDRAEGAVRRRAVLFAPGYDPRRPAIYHALFAEELAKAARLRGYAAACGPLEDADGPTPGFDLSARGEGWETRARLTLLRWDDVARPAFRERLLPRLPRLMAAGARFVAGGGLLRLARVDPQFAAFVIYPYVAVLTIALAAILVGVLVHAAAAGSLPLAAPLLGLAGAAGVVALALRYERPAFVRYLLEDWLFSFAHERGETDALQERIGVFAEAIRAAAADPENDEVLVIGHSSGGFVAPEALAEALRRDPDLARRGPAIGLATLGSVAALFVCDAPGTRYEEAVARLADEEGVVWREAQCRQDVMNAAPVDPVALAGRFPGRATRWPILYKVAMTQVAPPGRLHLHRERLFFHRIHFRWIRANERVHWYDFYGLLVGPRRFATIWSEATTFPRGVGGPARR